MAAAGFVFPSAEEESFRGHQLKLSLCPGRPAAPQPSTVMVVPAACGERSSSWISPVQAMRLSFGGWMGFFAEFSL